MNITLPRAVVQAALDILDAIELIEGPMYVSACRELRTALAQPQAEPSLDHLYAAWRIVGADVAGLDWNVFVAAIEAQPATQQEQKLPEFYTHIEGNVVSVYRRREDATPELIHRETFTAQAGEPVAFVIFDKQGEPHHVTAYRQAAHEHINDAIAEHGLTEASGWVVRPVYATPQPRKQLTPELIELVRADERARLLAVAVEPVATARVGREPHNYRLLDIEWSLLVTAGTNLFTADQVAAAVLKEREACAKVCDAVGEYDNGWCCAAAIRARGEG